jgi:sulfate transport system permease protein
MVSEIAPLLIVIRLEQFDYAGAAAIGVIMLTLSFLLIFALNIAQTFLRRRLGDV